MIDIPVQTPALRGLFPLGSRGGLGLGLEGWAAAGEHAAVDRQGRAGDPGGVTAGEEEDRLDDVARLAAAAERMAASAREA